MNWCVVRQLPPYSQKHIRVQRDNQLIVLQVEVGAIYTSLFMVALLYIYNIKPIYYYIIIYTQFRFIDLDVHS